jgi:hypothetical protein
LLHRSLARLQPQPQLIERRHHTRTARVGSLIRSIASFTTLLGRNFRRYCTPVAGGVILALATSTA